MKIHNKKILASILFVIISVVCVAQSAVPPPPETNDVPVLPIDGFTGVAVIIGAIYGVRKTIKNSKEH